MELTCERSMLDCELSENEEYPSEIESGGVSAPELIDVQVLERERPAKEGWVKTGMRTRTSVSKTKTYCKRPTHKMLTDLPLLLRSIPCSPNSVSPKDHALL
jgi:hypothetical protein